MPQRDPVAGDGRLLGPAQIRALAEELDLRPTKTLGQNFVHDANTVRRIVRGAHLQPAERVLEIGPGLGSLTLGLLDVGHPVTAVEIDPVLAGRLPVTVAEYQPKNADRLLVVTADALRLTELPGPVPTALVANLPYNVSVPVLLHLLATFPTLQRMLVMVQAEVAQRLAASPGSRTYGAPSVKAGWYAEVSLAMSVSRRVFWPEPNVDSALVRLTRRTEPPGDLDPQILFEVVDAAFGQRRKMLRSALAGLVGSSADAADLLRASGIDPAARGESLSVEDFVAVGQQYAARMAAEQATGGRGQPR